VGRVDSGVAVGEGEEKVKVSSLLPLFLNRLPSTVAAG